MPAHTASIADTVNPNVLDLDRTLLSVEQLIHFHLLTLVENAKAKAKAKDKANEHDFVDIHYATDSVCVPEQQGQ